MSRVFLWLSEITFPAYTEACLSILLTGNWLVSKFEVLCVKWFVDILFMDMLFLLDKNLCVKLLVHEVWLL